MREVFLTGYTPYPIAPGDTRMPHTAAKLHHKITKTALGAETSQVWRHSDDISDVLQVLRSRGFTLAAIEQAQNSIRLPDFKPPEKIALLLGREVEGIEPEVLALCDKILEIPMFGQKESFNVVQAAAMGLYHCTFSPLKT